MKKYLLYTYTLFVSFLVGCQMDNYEAPNAHLYGKILDVTSNLSVPQQTLNGAQFKLVQLEYSSQTANPITSYFHADGSYDNKLIFSGKYKVVLMGPFSYQDTVVAVVSGETNLDIKVKSYLNVTATVDKVFADSVQVSYTVKSNGNNEKIARVGAVLGTTLGVDINNFFGSQNRVQVNTEKISNEIVVGSTYKCTFKNLKPNTLYYIRGAGRTMATASSAPLWKNTSNYWNYTNIIKVTTLAK
jgi:hypothetical protein